MRFSIMITAVDAHAGGEPGRVIVGGVLDVPGRTMFEKKAYLETRADHLRRRMLREPRGYPAANCNLILPPTRPDADAGFVIMEQTEYPPMSGTNTICVVTVLIETGMVPAREPITRLRLETPAGLVAVEAEVAGGKVTRVTFENVPAFAVHLDTPVEVPTLGTVTVDVAYSGMFYVIADAALLGLRLAPDEARHCPPRGNDQSGHARTVAGGAPGKPGYQRRDDCPVVRAGSEPGRGSQERGGGLHRVPRLESAGLVDGRARSLALRHRHLRQDGNPARQGKTGTWPGLSPRRDPGDHLHRTTHPGNASGTLPGRGPNAKRQGLDHRLRPIRG